MLGVSLCTFAVVEGRGMKFMTTVDVSPAGFEIEPEWDMLFVGSCFAESIGALFADHGFNATVNPYGVMYNPASVLHTVRRYVEDGHAPSLAVVTLGTNHVYRLRSTGEIVDNCRKQPQKLFSEETLPVTLCVSLLAETVETLAATNADVRIVLTVSPIRYAKYGYHGSALSKATLLLSAEEIARRYHCCRYFPAYEIMNDELRDYRFYSEDMLHPSQQAAEYIYERFIESCAGPSARAFMSAWEPIRAALGHKPFRPQSEEYKAFIGRTLAAAERLAERYPHVRKIIGRQCDTV